MAEELTSTELVGQASQEVEGQAPETGGVPQKPKKVNLFEIPEFKDYQANQNRLITALQNQTQQLASQLRENQLKGMTDQDKRDYELSEARAQLAALQQEREQAEASARIKAAKQRDLARLSKLSGLSVEDLEDAETYDEAMDMAVAAAEKRNKSAEDAVDDDTPYVPSGRKTAPQTRAEQVAAEALKNRDGHAYLKAILGG